MSKSYTPSQDTQSTPAMTPAPVSTQATFSARAQSTMGNAAIQQCMMGPQCTPGQPSQSAPGFLPRRQSLQFRYGGLPKDTLVSTLNDPALDAEAREVALTALVTHPAYDRKDQGFVQVQLVALDRQKVDAFRVGLEGLSTPDLIAQVRTGKLDAKYHTTAMMVLVGRTDADPKIVQREAAHNYDLHKKEAQAEFASRTLKDQRMLLRRGNLQGPYADAAREHFEAKLGTLSADALGKLAEDPKTTAVELEIALKTIGDQRSPEWHQKRARDLLVEKGRASFTKYSTSELYTVLQFGRGNSATRLAAIKEFRFRNDIPMGSLNFIIEQHGMALQDEGIEQGGGFDPATGRPYNSCDEIDDDCDGSEDIDYDDRVHSSANSKERPIQLDQIDPKKLAAKHKNTLADMGVPEHILKRLPTGEKQPETGFRAFGPDATSGTESAPGSRAAKVEAWLGGIEYRTKNSKTGAKLLNFEGSAGYKYGAQIGGERDPEKTTYHQRGKAPDTDGSRKMRVYGQAGVEVDASLLKIYHESQHGNVKTAIDAKLLRAYAEASAKVEIGPHGVFAGAKAGAGLDLLNVQGKVTMETDYGTVTVSPEVAMGIGYEASVSAGCDSEYNCGAQIRLTGGKGVRGGITLTVRSDGERLSKKWFKAAYPEYEKRGRDSVEEVEADYWKVIENDRNSKHAQTLVRIKSQTEMNYRRNIQDGDLDSARRTERRWALTQQALFKKIAAEKKRGSR